MNNQCQSRTAREVAEIIRGELIGNGSLQINGLSSIDNDQANTITFLGNPKYARFLNGDQPRAVLVPKDLEIAENSLTTFIKVANVYESMSHLSHLFAAPRDSRLPELSAQCSVDSTASIGKDVGIGHFTIVEADVILEDNVRLGSQVFIGRGVCIGEGTIIHAGVKIMTGVSIGKRCIIYPNAVIGADGFGHAPSELGYRKLHHNGGVIIEDDVEIGSNSCIDSGVINSTIIRKGAKLDNLIQIAHGVDIGEHVAIAAQTGISGSSTIGNGAQIGGQVGVIGHVKIAADSKIQAKSGIATDIKKEGKKWYGYPGIPYYKYLRSYAIFKKLPSLMKRLRRLEELYDQK